MISLSINADTKIAQVPPEIYGGFVEHLGRNVYGGVYEPTSPQADDNGFRRDVIQAVRELGTPVTRYPGGCFTDTWRWEDGVGPRQNRPARLDYAWKQSEPNWFGLDEFMKWAELTGTEPVITLNLSTRGILEAADLFEYCNVPGGTYWSDKRRENGHEAPYNVRYWCLGNELYGHWEIGHKNARTYGALARETAKLFKMYDPTLKMILCGCSYNQEWNREVLDEAYEYVDMISLHETFDRDALSPEELLRKCDAFGQIIENTKHLCDWTKEHKHAKNTLTISVDEWIVWNGDKMDAPDSRWTVGRHLLEQNFSVLEGVLAGELFIMFHNHADMVSLACVAQSVNVIAPIRTEADGTLWKQTSFYPFALTSRHGRGTAMRILGCNDSCCASAIYNADSSELTLFMVSRNMNEPQKFTVALNGFSPSGILDAVTFHHEDFRAVNTPDAPATVPKTLEDIHLSGNGVVCGFLPPLSWNMIRISIRDEHAQ